MIEVATAINSFASREMQTDFVPPDNPILEIPLSEFQNVLEDLVLTYNQIAEMVKDAGILRGRDLARMTTAATDSLRATRSPLERILLLNAHTRQLLAKIRDSLKSRFAASENGKIIQVASKIQARAIKIVDYIKTLAEGKKEISLDSQQARILFSGAGGETVSRKETIRAMRRAEMIWPVLRCGHRPNDGRQTMRLVAKAEELWGTPMTSYRDHWQRSDRRVALSL